MKATEDLNFSEVLIVIKRNKVRECNKNDYMTFPRQFETYKWYKPIFVLLLACLFVGIFFVGIALLYILLSGEKDFSNANYYGYGALISVGITATILPAVAIASKIVKDRPFSSYSSSRGGWNWKIFFKCLLVAIPIIALYYAVLLISSDIAVTHVIEFTVFGFFATLIITPIQCISEEYLFRGLLSQTIASWTKSSIIGVIFSSLIFMLMHPQKNGLGLLATLICGISFAIIVWKTKGLEATGAMHTVINLSCFILGGFGIVSNTNQMSEITMLAETMIYVLYLIVIVFVADRKLKWFELNK